jgi:alcohol dehydrogenase class IV
MWRKILVFAIKAAVASGLTDKVLAWLKARLVKHVSNLEARVNADLDAVEAVAGAVEVSACDCPACQPENAE